MTESTTLMAVMYRSQLLDLPLLPRRCGDYSRQHHCDRHHADVHTVVRTLSTTVTRWVTDLYPNNRTVSEFPDPQQGTS